MSNLEYAFTVWDYVVFGAILLLSMVVGLVFACTGGKQQTNKEFLLADSKMGVAPVAVSMVVTILSAITMVGVPGEVYASSSEIWILAIGASLGAVLATVFFIPLLFPLKLTSAYEYLELRFKSKAVKLEGTFMTILYAVILNAVIMYASATAMETVNGAPVWLTLLISFAVSTIYSALGGLKAVIWVDTMQSFIMLGGLLIIIVQGTIKVGGLQRVFEINQQHRRLELFDFDPNPFKRHTFWTLTIGLAINHVAKMGIYQAAVQRYCAVPTINKARVATLLNIPILFVIWSAACLAGLTMFAYYADKGCDPLKAKIVNNPNQLIVYFMMDILDYPGLPGLFLGSIFCATLSTVTSTQSAAAAVTYEDMVKPCVSHLSEKTKTCITKFLVVFYGIVGTALSFVVQTLGGTVIQIGIAFVGASVGPLLGLFVLGAFFPCSNWKGAFVGGLVGLSFPLFLSIGAWVYWPPTDYLPSPGIHNCTNLVAQANGTATSMVTALFTTTASSVNTTQFYGQSYPESWKYIFTMSYQYYGCIGMASVVIVGLLVSFITCPTNSNEVDPRYLIPFFDRLFCGILPRSCTKRCQCHIEYYSVEGDVDSDDETDNDLYSNTSHYRGKRGLYTYVGEESQF